MTGKLVVVDLIGVLPLHVHVEFFVSGVADPVIHLAVKGIEPRLLLRTQRVQAVQQVLRMDRVDDASSEGERAHELTKLRLYRLAGRVEVANLRLGPPEVPPLVAESVIRPREE